MKNDIKSKIRKIWQLLIKLNYLLVLLIMLFGFLGYLILETISLTALLEGTTFKTLIYTILKFLFLIIGLLGFSIFIFRLKNKISSVTNPINLANNEKQSQGAVENNPCRIHCKNCGSQLIFQNTDVIDNRNNECDGPMYHIDIYKCPKCGWKFAHSSGERLREGTWITTKGERIKTYDQII